MYKETSLISLLLYHNSDRSLILPKSHNPYKTLAQVLSDCYKLFVAFYISSSKFKNSINKPNKNNRS